MHGQCAWVCGCVHIAMVSRLVCVCAHSHGHYAGVCVGA